MYNYLFLYAVRTLLLFVDSVHLVLIHNSNFIPLFLTHVKELKFSYVSHLRVFIDEFGNKLENTIIIRVRLPSTHRKSREYMNGNVGCRLRYSQ
jgi:hypothetical protein